MPAPPPTVRPQTIKQAKAAYKARGRPTLTEREKRQLERSIELDRRAWKAKEAEKRKAETARKKEEKARKEREDAADLLLGSQRRCDRFGYKSSQMHLGAFLNRKRPQEEPHERNLEQSLPDVEDEFEDSGVDDESLMAVTPERKPRLNDSVFRQLGDPRTLTAAVHIQQSPAFKQHKLSAEPAKPATSAEDDLSLFLDELGSSTQIARELDIEERPPARMEHQPNVPDSVAALCADDFDLSLDDLEELNPPKKNQPKAENDRRLMPPPALPVKRPPPPPPPPTATFDLGFTVSELEHCIDDDLQLTQAAPG